MASALIAVAVIMARWTQIRRRRYCARHQSDNVIEHGQEYALIVQMFATSSRLLHGPLRQKGVLTRLTLSDTLKDCSSDSASVSPLLFLRLRLEADPMPYGLKHSSFLRLLGADLTLLANCTVTSRR